MSISAITPGGGTLYSLTCSRARQGTEQRSFPVTGDGTEIWVIRRDSLRYFTHAGMETIAKNATENDPTLAYTGFSLMQTFNPFTMQSAASATIDP